MIALFVTSGLGIAGTAAAQMNAHRTAAISKVTYTQAVKNADAQFEIAKDPCASLSSNAKNVCVKEAKAELVKGKANAKVDRVASDTDKEAATKQAEARKDASADKREAELKVAIEKCDALAGPTKDACVSNAKAQFGQS